MLFCSTLSPGGGGSEWTCLLGGRGEGPSIPRLLSSCSLVVPGILRYHGLQVWQLAIIRGNSVWHGNCNKSMNRNDSRVHLPLPEFPLREWLSRLSLNSWRMAMSSMGISSLLVMMSSVWLSLVWARCPLPDGKSATRQTRLGPDHLHSQTEPASVFANSNPVWRSASQPIRGPSSLGDQSESSKVQICKVGCWYFYLSININQDNRCSLGCEFTYNGFDPQTITQHSWFLHR